MYCQGTGCTALLSKPAQRVVFCLFNRVLEELFYVTYIYDCVSLMFFLQMLQLLEPFSAAEALAIVKHVMEEQEVNWRSVLTVTSVLLTTFEEASSMLQGLLNRTITMCSCLMCFSHQTQYFMCLILCCSVSCSGMLTYTF